MADPVLNQPDVWTKRFNSYGALAVTLLVFAAFFVCLLTPLASGVTDLKETVKTVVVAVVFFWIGSNSGSAKKDETIAANSAALATSTPVPTTTSVTVSGDPPTATATTSATPPAQPIPTTPAAVAAALEAGLPAAKS